MRKAMVAIVLTAAIAAFPAVASASPSSGIEHFQLTQVDNQPGAILARGVFTASGVDYSKSNRDLAVFSNGAFTIVHPQSESTSTFTINPKTCLATFTFSGPYTVTNGFGAYQGIKGSGTYHGHSTGVVPRNPNGTCSHQEPFSTVTRITAEGPVSFS
jgi:hypothetical protein